MKMRDNTSNFVMRHTITRPQTPVVVDQETEICRCSFNDTRQRVVLEDADDITEFSSIGENASSQTTPNDSADDIVELYRMLIPILLSACFLSLLSNVLIICSARWIRRRRLSPNLMLSLSLAGADAFASLILGLGLVLNSLLPIALGIQLGPSSRCLVLSIEALRLGSLVSTALHLLALAANHHVGIAKPLHYVRIVTRRTTLVTAAAIWICPIAFFFIYFSSVPDDGFQSPGCSRYEFLLYSPFRATTSVLFFVPLVSMTVIYAHIFAIVRRHQPQNNSSSSRRLRRNVKAAVTTLLILGAYVLGWMPAVLYFALTCLDCVVPFPTIPLKIRVPIGVFANAMIAARCLADPVLYLIRMPEVRDALREMFGVHVPQTNGGSPCPSSFQNTRTDVKRLTLLTSNRKLNGYGNGRNVVTFGRNEMVL